MFAVAKIAESSVAKHEASTLARKVAPTIGKTALNVGVKGTITAMKMTSSMMSMIGSAVLGGLVLLFQLSK